MIRHGSTVLITSLAMLLLNIATGVMLARLLGPNGRGYLAATLLWPGLWAAIGSLGLGEAAVYFSARMPGREPAVTASALAVAICQSTLLAAGWYLLAPSILAQYGEETVRVSQLMTLSIPLALMSMATSGVLLGRLDVGAYNLQRLGGTVLTTLGLFGLFILRVSSLEAIVVMYLVVGVFTLGYSFVILISHRWLGLHADAALIRSLLSFGVRSHVGTVSGVANERADQALISIVLSPFYLGLYAVAVTLPTGVVMLGSSLAAVALPAVTTIGSETDMRRTLAQLARITLALSALAAGALTVAAPTVIRVFFGPAFLPSAPVAQVLILASILLSVNRVTSAGLRAFNRPFNAGAGDLVGAGVTVVSLGLLVPTIGLMGAAIASMLAYGANFAFNVWACGRLGMSARDLLLPNSSDIQLLRTVLRRGLIGRT